MDAEEAADGSSHSPFPSPCAAAVLAAGTRAG